MTSPGFCPAEMAWYVASVASRRSTPIRTERSRMSPDRLEMLCFDSSMSVRTCANLLSNFANDATAATPMPESAAPAMPAPLASVASPAATPLNALPSFLPTPSPFFSREPRDFCAFFEAPTKPRASPLMRPSSSGPLPAIAYSEVHRVLLLVSQGRVAQE